MDDVVRQATELGVERIVPLSTSRCVVRLDAGEGGRSRRALAADRGRGRASSRSARCRHPAGARHRRPPMRCPTGSRARRSRVLGGRDGAAGIGEAIARLASLGRCATWRSSSVPKAALTHEEVALLEPQAPRSCPLGATVLRTETAGVVAARSRFTRAAAWARRRG